tara:strand:- start:56 stop:238 length:183 start_codon:yes stop_codon:yes gene_type:complete
MSVETEKFKKKWRREKGGHTSNEESDEKTPKAGFQNMTEAHLQERARRNSRTSITQGAIR